MAWLAKWAGGPGSGLPSGRSSRPRGNGNGENRIRSYVQGSAATANLRQYVTFYVSFGILTDERNSYVLLQRSTEIGLRVNGNVTLETRGPILEKS